MSSGHLPQFRLSVAARAPGTGGGPEPCAAACAPPGAKREPAVSVSTARTAPAFTSSSLLASGWYAAGQATLDRRLRWTTGQAAGWPRARRHRSRGRDRVVPALPRGRSRLRAPRRRVRGEPVEERPVGVEQGPRPARGL